VEIILPGVIGPNLIHRGPQSGHEPCLDRTQAARQTL
jgi:hypothetical protein